MRRIDWIVIHCAYTPSDMDIGVAEIRRWHKARGFRDVGYHFVVRRDGQVERGRPEEEIGAHALGYNHNSIGICMVGGKAAGDEGIDCNFTRHQWGALESLVQGLKEKYQHAVIRGHRDLARRGCPTFDAEAWWAA